ncbi:unnamed protein product [Linum trigynum]|uniref:RNase H type-1 domain-containing protein n=1 Tax=Linum trigynum TaxID=586398 RepID=A0AAV2E8Y5_9ROSI
MRTVKAKSAWFKIVEFLHVPREDNAHDNALSKLATALDFEGDRHIIVTKEHSPKESVVGEIIGKEMEEVSWMQSLKVYLLQGVVPEDAKEAWQVRRKVARCTIIDGQLYK